MGMIPKTTKEEIKIVGGLSLARIVGAVMILIFSTSVGETIVASKLVIPFTAYLLILYMILTSKSSNPKKTFAVAMIDYFKYLFTNKEYTRESSGRKEDIVAYDHTEAQSQIEEIIEEA